MGYWTIPMCPESQRICTIILTCGKFSYERLPMGLAPSPDVYQEKMSLLFIDLEEVKVYFDDILVLRFDSFEDPLLNLQVVLTCIRKANLQVNVTKSKCAAIETEYLGFNISWQDVKPQEKKIEAIMNIATPTNVRQVCSLLVPPTITSKWFCITLMLLQLSQYQERCQLQVYTQLSSHFWHSKLELAKWVMLTYTNFSKPFEIYTDTSKLQLGAVISQENHPLAFYSCELSDAQTRYTVIEL